MKAKKILLPVMALALAGGFGACGSDDDDKDKQHQTEKTDGTDTETPTTPATPEPTSPEEILPGVTYKGVTYEITGLDYADNKLHIAYGEQSSIILTLDDLSTATATVNGETLAGTIGHGEAEETSAPETQQTTAVKGAKESFTRSVTLTEGTYEGTLKTIKVVDGQRGRYVNYRGSFTLMARSSEGYGLFISVEDVDIVPADYTLSLIVEATTDIFNITGRGVVVTGRLQGSPLASLKTGDRIRIENTPILSLDDERMTYKNEDVTVEGIEMFRKLMDEAQPGDNIGIQLDSKFPTEDITYMKENVPLIVQRYFVEE